MKKIITALAEPQLNNELKKEKDFIVIGKDIQYQEGVIEILETEKEVDFLIISEALPGNEKIENLIEKIKQINNEVNIVIILENKKEELENIVLTLKKEINQSPQCHHCHQSKPLNVYLLDDEIDILCSDCFEKHERITKHTASPLGILGAFIGAVIGGIIWAFGYNLGYIICLDAILLSLLSFIGF